MDEINIEKVKRRFDWYAVLKGPENRVEVVKAHTQKEMKKRLTEFPNSELVVVVRGKSYKFLEEKIVTLAPN